MMFAAAPVVKSAFVLTVPAYAVASGHTAISRSFWAYWLRAGIASQYRPYPVRSTVVGLIDHARPTRGPQLSFTGPGEKNSFPAITTLPKCGSDLNASGMHGAVCATLQNSGIFVAPMIHFWF